MNLTVHFSTKYLINFSTNAEYTSDFRLYGCVIVHQPFAIFHVVGLMNFCSDFLKNL